MKDKLDALFKIAEAVPVTTDYKEAAKVQIKYLETFNPETVKAMLGVIGAVQDDHTGEDRDDFCPICEALSRLEKATGG